VLRYFDNVGTAAFWRICEVNEKENRLRIMQRSAVQGGMGGRTKKTTENWSNLLEE